MFWYSAYWYVLSFPMYHSEVFRSMWEVPSHPFQHPSYCLSSEWHPHSSLVIPSRQSASRTFQYSKFLWICPHDSHPSALKLLSKFHHLYKIVHGVDDFRLSCSLKDTLRAYCTRSLWLKYPGHMKHCQGKFRNCDVLGLCRWLDIHAITWLLLSWHCWHIPSNQATFLEKDVILQSKHGFISFTHVARSTHLWKSQGKFQKLHGNNAAEEDFHVWPKEGRVVSPELVCKGLEGRNTIGIAKINNCRKHYLKFIISIRI